MRKDMPLELKLIVAQMTIESIDYRAINLFAGAFFELARGKEMSAREMALRSNATFRHAPSMAKKLAAYGYLIKANGRYKWRIGDNLIRDPDFVRAIQRLGYKSCITVNRNLGNNDA